MEILIPESTLDKLYGTNWADHNAEKLLNNIIEQISEAFFPFGTMVEIYANNCEAVYVDTKTYPWKQITAFGGEHGTTPQEAIGLTVLAKKNGLLCYSVEVDFDEDTTHFIALWSKVLGVPEKDMGMVVVAMLEVWSSLSEISQKFKEKGYNFAIRGRKNHLDDLLKTEMGEELEEWATAIIDRPGTEDKVEIYKAQHEELKDTVPVFWEMHKENVEEPDIA